MDILIEGKTKKIIAHEANRRLAYMVSKDDITAGNGAKRDIIEGKAALSTRTNANIMTFLNQEGFLTAFVRQVDDVTQLVRRCTMIPVECVARGVAFGSYLKRNPQVEEGQVFREPVVEFFYKDDVLDDPFMNMSSSGTIMLHHAGRPVTQETVVRQLSLPELMQRIGWREPPARLFSALDRLTSDIFRTLAAKWQEQEVLLVDMKVEFGIESTSGAVLLADVIDNDSWRCWPKGDKAEMLDKQVYRDMKIATPQALESFKGKLKEVADRTDRFIA